MALGAAIGGALGTAGGAILGGPIGAGIGGGIGSAIGGAVDLAGQETPDVARVDPNQVARLEEIRQTKREIESGMDPLTRQRIADIKQTGETTKSQLGKFTGGDVGGTLSAMLRAQRNIGRAQNQAFTQSQQRLPFFENLESQLQNRISQRKLELDIHAQDRALAERANTQRQIIGGISGAIGSAAGAFGGGAGGGLLGGGGAAAGGGGVNAVGNFEAPVGSINPVLPPAPNLAPGNIGQQFQQGISGGTGVGGFGQTLGGGFGG